ncbi:MAG: hypothetical protein PeribacterA2_0769 [Candidatus Peribacter riflensis]|uniref:Uncharacterized protein n=1 Tax=Candidatus Peribacter riflensis TaxID=1735162 RepID=A0A0S1SM60_9BACT|nr:MAG: hypothetical protein PeribacterA2_0769 [Candidatus Peribacter riflensis]OGJ77819.1 MAG: hypothetical protein A2398_00925 [Candidatus Peribacteria bacterium RIFOXYB1_FULL_57_12]OGJ82781.1 MAG: hypothetical protein A2412_00795 [Candidatus Peribacteria bacterium RIFOXYC1_FULL_58_8]ALM11237.1 MAG: hypothetical protein PeribacterB2_0771 [Candidatus Peribacter riflensis]ALM12340.1 MAG: hypothetical protein PeribacterC2_0771 [Candidatus Peribacter riflensis]
MSTAILERPHISDGSQTDAQAEQDIRIGPYLVTDRKLIRRAAMDLMQRCLLRGIEIPSEISTALCLHEQNQHAMGMEEALLAMPDLQDRRAIICQMVHAIIRL